MANYLTVDNADDIIRRTLKEDLAEIKRKIDNLERLVKEDISLDRRQDDERPDSETKLDFLSSRIDNLQNDTTAVRNEINELRKQISLLFDTLQGIKEEL